jgi:hypothetical protein
VRHGLMGDDRFSEGNSPFSVANRIFQRGSSRPNRLSRDPDATPRECAAHYLSALPWSSHDLISRDPYVLEDHLARLRAMQT